MHRIGVEESLGRETRADSESSHMEGLQLLQAEEDDSYATGYGRKMLSEGFCITSVTTCNLSALR